MALTPDMFAPAMTAMHSGSLVLTPNHRTRLQLLAAYGQWRQQHDLSPVCTTPAVFPVDIWLRDHWLEAPGERAGILEPGLEGLVWQDIVRDSEAGAGLVNQRATARAVQEAWRLAHLWHIDMASVRRLAHFQRNADLPDDLGAFLSWVDAFETFCRRQGLISLSPLVKTVIAEFDADTLAAPERVLLAGFENPPPLYADLITVLINSSKSCIRFDVPAQAPAIRQQACRDSAAENGLAAAWARDVLASDPQARIGIICPDLHRRAPALQRRFRDVLHPEQATLDSPDTPPLFSLSGTQALADCPLLASALDCLGLNTPWVDTLSFCRLLRSPFLATAEVEETARARLEWRLRDTGEMQVQLAWVRDLARNAETDHHCEQLAAALLAFDTLRRACPNTATLQAWSTLFEDQLAALGWPGTRSPDPAEYRQLKAWSRALQSFALVSSWHGKVPLATALAILRQILSGATLGDDNDLAPVQIVTPTEADGLVFTHTWMLGMTEQQWPPPARPVPFIPLGLQREKAMPGSDVHALTAAARRQLERVVAHTGTQVVFSWPCQEEDLVLRPSGMMPATADIGSAGETCAPAFPGYLADTVGIALDTLHESALIPLGDDEDASGGTSLIADQADCPFRAFAVHRLGARPLPAPVIGLPGHVLGSILHEALEIFWRTLQTQENLLHSTPDMLAETVSTAVTAAVHNKARFYRHTMTARFNAMEIQRLTQLLLAWMEEEKRRGTFRVIASEHRTTWQHAGLTLNLRIDRLDEVDDGKRIIVDYKSSKNSEINWFDPRQTEPQLMLYMLAVEAEQAEHVAGLFIAQVNVEETKYKGISDDDAIYPKSHFSNKRYSGEEPDWSRIRQSWQESLTAVANEFLAGYAAVAPKSVSSSCTWCHLGGFCRVSEVLDT